jgi:hypothetical protein
LYTLANAYTPANANTLVFGSFSETQIYSMSFLLKARETSALSNFQCAYCGSEKGQMPISVACLLSYLAVKKKIVAENLL